MQEYTYINVGLDRPLRKNFHYKLQGTHSSEIIGSRVQVNFANKDQIGIVVSIVDPKDITYDVNKIKLAKLLDKKSLISKDVFDTIVFGANFYQYPLGQALKVALPKLLRDGAAATYESIFSYKLANFTTDISPNLKGHMQQKLVELLKKGPILRSTLLDMGFAQSTIGSLEKKGLIVKFDANELEFKTYDQIKPILKEENLKLNDEQQQATDAINSADCFKVFLLNGITGSGKTEVYLQAIYNTLSKGKRALVLVPEIALTPQTFERFFRRFNVPVSSMHSSVSQREKLDAYLDMLYKKSGILIGTRSALFTPIENLGLIIVDEEHDSSFKQADNFRYHAKYLAIIRAKYNNCPIVLGSATASLESVYNCKLGKYTLLNLTKRAGGAIVPQINIIDLKQEPVSEGYNTGCSQQAEFAIGQETVKGNQVLLFLNRRGYSHHLICHQCGHIFTCKNCDNPMTVHKNGHKLHCHICDHITKIPDMCPKCGSFDLYETGFGTQMVEEYLSLRYPDVKVQRIDSDSITNKNQLHEALDKIRKKQCALILGTQIVAKGHDFPDVTLVTIIDIDSGLFSDDFRALEYSAQLITQVAGRAGRAKKQGIVQIQTHHPDHALLKMISDPAVSYLDIANALLENRRELNLPPYSFQAFLLANSTIRENAYNMLKDVYDNFSSIAKELDVAFGIVMSDKIEKRNNRYNFHILLQAKDRQKLYILLNQIGAFIDSYKFANDTRFAFEVDPINMY